MNDTGSGSTPSATPAGTPLGATPAVPPRGVEQTVWTTGQGNTGAQGAGNQLNVFLNSPPAQRIPSDETVSIDGLAQRPPGALPAVWNLGPRNPGFAGRESELARLREQLCSGGAAVVQALHGMGGIGKTQLASEYAYRHAADYDAAWWISAEQPGLIGEQYRALGASLGVVAADADSVVAASAVKSHLRSRDRWLLVFDNAESPDDIARWLPGGPGHIIITSRHQRWTQLAVALDVGVLTRTESVQLLRTQHPMLDRAEADELAEALGDLPLALAQAAGFLAETGMSTEEYQQALASQAGELLDEGRPVSYPRSLAATIAISTDRLAAVDPAALAILRLCAFLAPEPVPVELVATIAQFEAAPEDDTWGLRPLATVIDKPLARRRSIGRLNDYGLAKVTEAGIVVHRLVQAVLRDQLPPPAVTQLQARIEAVLSVAEPGDPRDPVSWPSWARLLPHLLAANPADSDNPELRGLACQAIVMLIARGDARPAQRLAERLYRTWRDALGADHPQTLKAATELVWANRDLGELHKLRPLVEDTLTRQRATLGEDHPDTLRSASDLAVVFSTEGKHAEARKLDEQVLTRRRSVLGEDHLDTLTSASNLASSLNDLGNYQQALVIHQEVLKKRQRLLGEDHPDTLGSTNNLASSLSSLGDYQEALRLRKDVLERQRRTLGADHPDTLTSASNLASSLNDLGNYQQALLIQQEVLEKRQRLLGEDHPDTLRAITNLAGILMQLRGYEQARKMLEDTMEKLRTLVGEDHPETLSVINDLAGALTYLGDYERAHRMHKHVLEKRQQALGDDHPLTLTSAGNLAGALRDIGDCEQARHMQEQALEREKRTLGADHPSTLSSASNLASILVKLGDYEEARRIQREVLEKRQHVLGDNHPLTLTSASNLAVVFSRLGDHEEALRRHQQVLKRQQRLLGDNHPDVAASTVRLSIEFAHLGQRIPARQLAEQGFRKLRAALGSDHPLTHWAGRNLNSIKGAMGGRRQATGRRK
ncbi:FxSxx-COOH system tetratricopeptide repeat protein [Micromonospora sp. NPDC049559]|uniref:FxSxx-COOH system tetratricopeptide repeat protein n=1 Tax=Micromonospora sp. NPDC049559 TaxID=3155923 RepID=UPI003428D4B1